jgi:hypothetical protein
MQSQMIGMQSSLDRILSAVQSPSQSNNQQLGYSTNVGQGSTRDAGPSYPLRNRYVGYIQGWDNTNLFSRSSFPPLPGFAPPVCLPRFLQAQR